MNLDYGKVVEYIKFYDASEYYNTIPQIKNNYSWLVRGLRDKFYESHDLEYYQIGLYHGTSLFAYELDEANREKYRKAFRDYVSACIKSDHEYLLDQPDYKHTFEEIKSGNTLFEYHDLYVTTSLRQATEFASKTAFGELGELGRLLYREVNSEQVKIEVDKETIDAIDEFNEKTKAFYQKYNTYKIPVVLKFKSYDFTDIAAEENSNEFSKSKIYNWLKHGNLPALMDFQNDDGAVNLRMAGGITLNDFEEVNVKNEAYSMMKNIYRILKDLDEFIDRFCDEHKQYFEDTESLDRLKNMEFGTVEDITFSRYTNHELLNFEQLGNTVSQLG